MHQEETFKGTMKVGLLPTEGVDSSVIESRIKVATFNCKL